MSLRTGAHSKIAAAPNAARVARGPALPESHPIWWKEPALVRRLVPSATFGVCAAAVAAGSLSLSINSLDFLRVWLMAPTTISLFGLMIYGRYETSSWDRGTVALVVLSAVATIFLAIWPHHFYGHQINGIIDRSLLMSFFLIAIGLPGMCNALFWVLDGTPTAWDTSRYPLLLFPIALVLFLYGVLLFRLVVDGGPDLSWHIITTAYSVDLQSATFERTAGMRNHVFGTLLLMLMTSVFSLPVGVAVGLCVSEYRGWYITVISFCTQMLRAISVFILAVFAFTIAKWSAEYPVGDWRSDWFRGYYLDHDGFKIAGHGSFLTAALVLSLLVIPVIARSAEEGFRSMPRDIREGSVALGATEGHGLLFLMLPWALPNIVTGVLLGCAEAAGSVAVILFISGSGEFGVGPFREVTSLAYLVYYSGRGPKPFLEVMGQYQFSAALLLLCITFALSIAALILKQKFGQRYRGATSNQ